VVPRTRLRSRRGLARAQAAPGDDRLAVLERLGHTGAILWTVNGQQAGDKFGYAVAGVGDLNDDGKDDFAVGAPSALSNKGKVTLYSGANRAVLQRINGDAAGDRFGEAIAGSQFSLTNITWTYLLIGAPHYSGAGTNIGRVKFYTRNHTTPACGTTVCFFTSFNGENVGDQFGTSVAQGQIFGPSQPELLIGAPFADLNGTSSGAAYLFDGGNLALAQRFLGEADGDQFGTSVAIVGDIDADTDTDLAVGAPRNDFAGSDAGRVYVFRNNLVSAAATFGDGPMGATVDRFADLNRDGSVDAADVIALVTAFGPCPQADTAPCTADVDRSGVVDTTDLIRLLKELR
jgi:hypothetical protein